MLKPEHEAFTKAVVTILGIIASTIASTAIYMLIVRLLFIKIINLSTVDDGGYTATFGETLFLTVVILVLGYLLFSVLRFILQIKSRTYRIILGGLSMPAAYIDLFYTGFGVAWYSPTTYVYLLLLFTSGVFIIYIPYYFTRHLRTAN
jgi:hypothetical protein